MQPWQDHNWITHTQILLNSYRRFLGEELVVRDGSDEEQSQVLFEADFVVVSHATQADPILNYGNRAALNLWEIDLDTLLQTPSRMTAEPVHRDERARLMERTTRDGFVDDYRGVRIASTGRRFLIEQAIVWNLVNDAGDRVGQAATFSDWVFLDE
jgi:hypothetical protein